MKRSVPTRTLSLLAALLCVGPWSLSCSKSGGDEITPLMSRIVSPNGELMVTVAALDLEDGSDDPTAQRLYFKVFRDASTALDWSPLGIRTSAGDFVEGLTFKYETEGLSKELLTMNVGKRRLPRHYEATQKTYSFANAAGDRILITFRLSDDGVAYRYELLGEGEVTVLEEESGFRIPDGANAWLKPLIQPGMFWPAYENVYQATSVGESTDSAGWAYPALFRLEDEATYLLIHESGLDETYAATRLRAEVTDGIYRIGFPMPGEGNGEGQPEPTSTLPLDTPWRVAIIGDANTVVESTLVDELAPRANRGAAAFSPGRVAWSWLTQDTGDSALQEEYIDFAHEMGWEYVLIDANWNLWPDPEAEVRALVDYGRQRNVRLILWYNSGGPNNLVTEEPRDRMSDRETRKVEFSKLADWGIRGVKVDFFQSDNQDRIAQYIGILEDALEAGIAVNFHGCTVPRGWQRTYPNLMTMEAVRGAETYRASAGVDAIDNVRYVFTRNVVGSMDYTPVTFSHAWERREIPYAHQLALAVVFESGWLHFADRADADPNEGYRRVIADFPFVADFFKRVPAAWDDTRWIDGDPDTHAVLARRSGDDWYLAGISGWEIPFQLQIPLGFLGEGEYAYDLIGSQPDDPQRMKLEQGATNAEGSVTVSLGAKDGFVVYLRPKVQ